MADCEYRRSCAFFQNRMDNLPGTAGIYRQKYCHADRLHCAIYVIHKSLGRDKVPPDLLPYHHERARKILQEGAGRLTA